MPTFEINYDLHAPDKNYDAVIGAIKSHPGWCHVLKSCWLVNGRNLTLEGVTAKIKAAADKDDSYFIREFSKPYSGWLPKNIHNWIDQHA